MIPALGIAVICPSIPGRAACCWYSSETHHFRSSFLPLHTTLVPALSCLLFWHMCFWLAPSSVRSPVLSPILPSRVKTAGATLFEFGSRTKEKRRRALTFVFTLKGPTPLPFLHHQPTPRPKKKTHPTGNPCSEREFTTHPHREQEHVRLSGRTELSWWAFTALPPPPPPLPTCKGPCLRKQLVVIPRLVCQPTIFSISLLPLNSGRPGKDPGVCGNKRDQPLSGLACLPTSKGPRRS